VELGKSAGEMHGMLSEAHCTEKYHVLYSGTHGSKTGESWKILNETVIKKHKLNYNVVKCSTLFVHNSPSQPSLLHRNT
jgi:hypothetical protein